MPRLPYQNQKVVAEMKIDKKILTFFIASLVTNIVLSSFLVAETVASPAIAATQGETQKHTMALFQTEADIDKKYRAMLDTKIKDIGYIVVDPHYQINESYKKKYGSTTLDLLSFVTIVNPDVIKPFLNIDPRIAGFNPFDVLLYKPQGSKISTVAHLTPDAILGMLDIKDETIRSNYIKSFEPLDAMIAKEIGGEKSYIDYSEMTGDRIMNFEIDFKRPEDLDDFIDTFQEKFEAAFEAKKYIIAGFYNYKQSFDGTDKLPKFDAFWIYSLCHFTFSYTIFDNEGAKTQAGVFAPCTMYMYIEKGSNKLVIGMPRLSNWAAMAGITDKKRVDYIASLDKEIPEIMVSLGAKEVESTPFPLPAAQSAAAAQTQGSIKSEESVTQTIQELPARVVSAPSKAGHPINGEISTFLTGPMASVAQVTADLKSNGFEVLSSMPIDKSGALTTVVFTNESLKKMAQKKERGFAGVLRLLVDETNKQISITNPLYFAKAYMQKEYDEGAALEILDRVNGAFEGLGNSKDKMPADALERYHFMMGMPYYEEMDEIAQGENGELLAKVKASGKMLFELPLGENATLVGVELDGRTSKFATKIGAANGAILPYTVLIEDGKARSLAPKYNIALYYPLLEMTQFMTIATIPGAIVSDLENAFK